MAVQITRNDKDSNTLRKIARKCSDGFQASRLFALADVMDGEKRTVAAERHGMTRQTLRDWVHRYNDEGVSGLKDRHRTGCKPILNDEQWDDLARIVRAGPDPDKDGVARWRQVDLRDWLAREHGIICHERTVGKWLHKLGFACITTRPKHLKNDPKAIELFKKVYRYSPHIIT